jgi:hypothetical protein
MLKKLSAILLLTAVPALAGADDLRPEYVQTPQGTAIAMCWGDDIVNIDGEPWCRVNRALTGKALDDAVEAQRRKHASDPVMLRGGLIAMPCREVDCGARPYSGHGH